MELSRKRPGTAATPVYRTTYMALSWSSNISGIPEDVSTVFYLPCKLQRSTQDQRGKLDYFNEDQQKCVAVFNLPP